MAGGELTITHPEKGTGTIAPELLQQAQAKGWSLAGDVPISHPEKGTGVVDASLLPEALGKGWAVAGGGPREDTTVGLPDIPLAADQGPVTLEAFAPDLQQREEQATLVRAQQDIAAQRQREEQQANLEREFGVGFTGQGLANAVQTAGEGLSRGVSLGFDAPMAYAQAGAAKLAEAVAGPANPDLPLTFGAALNEAQRGIEGHQQANPVTAGVSDAAGAVLPALATGGKTLAMRLAARAPSGVLARKAAGMGVSAAGRLGLTGAALEAPGLAGSLRRIAAPVVRLGVEGGAQGAIQGGARGADDLWMSDDAASVWDIARAGAGEMWDGGLLGTVLGGGVGLGLGLRAARGGAGAAKSMQGLDLTLEAPPSKAPPAEPGMTYTAPDEAGAVRSVMASKLKLTPEQATEARKVAYPKTRDKWNEFLTLGQRFDNELDIAAKKNFVRANAQGPAPTDFGSVRAELGLDRASLEALAEHGAVKFDGKGGAATVLRLASQLDSLEDDLFLQATRETLTEGDVFIALDQAKRDTQKAIAQANRNNPFLFDTLDPKGIQIRGFLEDDAAWSPALAKMQRETNEGWAKSISARMDSDLGSMAAERGVKSQWNPYDLEEKVSDSWLMSHMNGIGAHPVEEQTAQAVNRWLNATSDDVLTRARAYGGKELNAAAERMNTLRRELQQELGEVAKVNANTAPAGAPALGVLGQVPGAAYVTEAALDRARQWAHKQTVTGLEAVDRAAELRALVGKARPSVAGAVVRGVQGGEKASKAVEDYLRVALTGEPTKDEQDALAVLERAFGPAMAQAAAADMQRQREFLLNKSQTTDRLTLRRYADAALRPVEAIKRISEGSAYREDRETLEALNPALLKRFTDTALEKLSSTETTYDDRLRASQALALPLDPSLEPGRYAQHQEMAARQSLMAKEKQEQGSAVLTPGNRREPRMGKLMEE